MVETTDMTEPNDDTITTEKAYEPKPQPKKKKIEEYDPEEDDPKEEEEGQKGF